VPSYSEVGGQHDFSIVESSDPSGACREQGLVMRDYPVEMCKLLQIQPLDLSSCLRINPR